MVIYTFYTKECLYKITQGHLCGYSAGFSASESLSTEAEYFVQTLEWESVSYSLWKWLWFSCGETTAMCTSVHLPTMHRHVAVSLLHNPPVLFLQEQKGRRADQWKNTPTVLTFNLHSVKDVSNNNNKDVCMLTSTSAAPGSLLKHMVMVFRAILKKLVKDTDFPCNKEAFTWWVTAC